MPLCNNNNNNNNNKTTTLGSPRPSLYPIILLCCFGLLVGTSPLVVAAVQQQHHQQQHSHQNQISAFPIGPDRTIIRRAPFIHQQRTQHTKSATVFVAHPPAIRPPKGVAVKLNRAKLRDFFMQIKKMKKML